jgi:hypothetical protein
MDRPRDAESELNSRREKDDAAESDRRSSADTERENERTVSDAKRENVRGARQSREGIARERVRDDESLRAERGEADTARDTERRHADQSLAREKLARADAVDALDEKIDRDARRDADLREALALVKGQIEVVEGSLSRLHATVPRGTFDGRLSADVEKIRDASRRTQRLLEDVLDPGDGRRRYHEVGGSG